MLLHISMYLLAQFGDTPLGIARSQGLEHITQLLCDANKLRYM